MAPREKGGTSDKAGNSKTQQSSSSRGSGEIDRLIGARARLARIGRGMSQEALAEKLGVSFQQLQKYEHGLNRISASRLYQMASALEVPLTFFFDDLKSLKDGKTDSSEFVLGLQDRAGVELIQDFNRISDQDARKAITSIVKSMAMSLEGASAAPTNNKTDKE